MKILILLLFITCHAYGQTTTKIYWAYNNGVYTDVTPSVFVQDTVPGYMHTRGTWIPGDSSISELLHIRFRKVMVQDVMMGQKAVYTPETDREQGNSVNQKSRIITYQIAMDDVITEEQKDRIKQAIDLIMFNSPGTPVVIDTVDAVNSTFVGKWSNVVSTTANWYGGTLSFSNEAGAYATYKDLLPYKRVEIWAEQKWTHGKVQIFLDNVPVGDPVDLYNPAYKIPHLVKDIDVPLGIHEIKYQIVGEKNPASIDMYGLIDFYRFFR